MPEEGWHQNILKIAIIYSVAWSRMWFHVWCVGEILQSACIYFRFSLFSISQPHFCREHQLRNKMVTSNASKLLEAITLLCQNNTTQAKRIYLLFTCWQRRKWLRTGRLKPQETKTWTRRTWRNNTCCSSWNLFKHLNEVLLGGCDFYHLNLFAETNINNAVGDVGWTLQVYFRRRLFCLTVNLLLLLHLLLNCL